MNTNSLIIREVLLSGKMVLEFDLLQYRHVWLNPYIVAVQMNKWHLYEILKYEPDVLIAREIAEKESLEEVEICLRQFSL